MEKNTHFGVFYEKQELVWTIFSQNLWPFVFTHVLNNNKAFGDFVLTSQMPLL